MSAGAEVRRPGRRNLCGHVGRVAADAADLVPGQQQRRVAEPVAAHVTELVAEHRRVERLGPLEVAAHLLAPGKRAGHVGDLHAGVRVCLPGAEYGTGGVSRDQHAADVHHVHRVHHQLAAGALDLGRGRVGVLGRDVGHPDARRLGRPHLRPDPGGGPAVEVRDRVTARLRRTLLDVPAEQSLVEGDCLRYVGDAEVDPARRPFRPWGVAGNHISPPCRDAARTVASRAIADANTWAAGLLQWGDHVQQDQPRRRTALRRPISVAAREADPARGGRCRGSRADRHRRVQRLGNDQYGPSANGCVNLTIAGTTGGGTLHYCGGQAKAFCRTAYTSDDRLSRLGRPQCVLAGLTRAKVAAG